MRMLRLGIALLALPFFQLLSEMLLLPERKISSGIKGLLVALALVISLPLVSFWLQGENKVVVTIDKTAEQLQFEKTGEMLFSESDVVFFTPGGSVFHASSDCIYLQRSNEISSAPLSSALRQRKLLPCSSCYLNETESSSEMLSS